MRQPMHLPCPAQNQSLSQNQVMAHEHGRGHEYSKFMP